MPGNAGVPLKIISHNQIIGERGVALAKDKAHEMGFLFTTYGPVEAGIDALVELRDPQTGAVSGKLIAVQVRTREERRYTAETEHGFEYVCTEADTAYWQQPNLPMIIVLVRLSDRSLYWKRVPSIGNPADIETRRLRISKASDKFDRRAADKIAHLAVDQAQPGVWLPPSNQPDTLLFNAVKVTLPDTIFTAATTYRRGGDALRALLEIKDHPPGEWVIKGGRLVTFLNIEDTLLRHVVDVGSIEPLPTSQFAFHEDQDERRVFVELLNRTLRAQLEPMLTWNNSLQLHYFPPDGRVVDRTIRYMSLQNETTRAVVKAKRRPDGSISYVRHSAFSARFWPEFDSWLLTIEPTYVFTRDGVRPDKFAGERVSKLKRLENNAALRGQFVMWRTLLTGLGAEQRQGDLLSLSSPVPKHLLRFEPIGDLTLPVSVPDALWRSRDSFAPPDDDEELPL